MYRKICGDRNCLKLLGYIIVFEILWIFFLLSVVMFIVGDYYSIYWFFRFMILYSVEMYLCEMKK